MLDELTIYLNQINQFELLKIADIISNMTSSTFPSLDIIYNYFINMS